jgi:hypothetical protein
MRQRKGDSVEKTMDESEKSRLSEAGDTLIEVLLAIVVLGMTSVAIIVAFATSISGSAEHRSLATMDTVLRSAAEQAISQIQQQSSAQFGQCPVPDAVTFSLPTGYTAALGSVQYWNGSGFGSACTVSTAAAPHVNAPQLVAVTVTSPSNVTSSPLNFVVDDPLVRPTPVAGAATHLVFLASPNGSVTAGSSFPTQPVIAVEDANNNVVTSDFSAVTLNITAGTGAVGASISNTCTGSVFEGVVTFSGCSIGQVGTGFTLTASDPETNATTNAPLISATSSPFNVTAAPASQLVFNATPGPGIAGSAIPNVSVTVEDTFGNVVTAASGTVTMSIQPGSAQLSFNSGTTTVSVLNGVATFSNLVVDTAGSYTLTATPSAATGLTLPVSSSGFTVSAAAASTFAVSNPGTQTVGSSFGENITAFDPYGNIATGFTGSQTLAFSGASNSPNGTAPTYPASVTFSSGLATATGITLVNAQPTTLTVSLGPVTGNTGSFNVLALPATKFTLSNPGSATAGTPFNETITATDVDGNIITSYSGLQTLVFSGPSNSPSPSPTSPTYPGSVSFASGVGIASIKLVDAQSTALTATQGTVAGTSTTFTVVSGSPNKLVFSPAAPGPGTVTGVIPHVAVQVQDTYNNPITTAVGGSITLGIKSGGPQATFTSGTTSASPSGGVATFSNLVVATAGTYTFTATPVSMSGVTVAANSTAFTVNVAPNITTTTLPTATDGQVGYSQTLAVTGGTGPYTWSTTTGNLPAGLSISSAGVISGTVSATATTQIFTVGATDSNGVSDTQQLTLTVNPASIITTASLATATQGQTGYSQTLTLTGGTAAFTWAVSSGTLPTGLSLSPSGVITGTVGAAATTQTFTVRVTDNNGVTATKALTITVNVSPNITTSSLATATAGEAGYSQTMAVSGGTTPFTWSISSGSLPSGLSIGPSTGIIGGTVGGSATTQTFTVKATDFNGVFDTQQLTLTVNATPNITTTSVAQATQTGAYSQSLSLTGGTGTDTWSISAGTLPSGLSISSSTGTISGPAGSTATTQTFTVRVVDGNGVADAQQLTLTVNAPPNITTTTLTSGEQQTTVSRTLNMTGGTGTDTWSISAGSLPSGLGINASTGVISGTLGASASTQTFTVKVIDANGVFDTQQLTFTVTASPTILTSSLNNAPKGNSYTATLAATGGSGGYSWTVSSGSLPAGLNLSSGGVISGTPTGPKVKSTFTVQVTDSNGASDTQSLSITVS